MLKKTFFVASVIILIVAYAQLSSFHADIQQAFPMIVIHSMTSSSEADETIKSLFNQCDIQFQSTLLSGMYLGHSERGRKNYYRLTHLRKPVHQPIESLIKEFENSQKANAHTYYLLESPTLNALKQLRLNIEHNSKGTVRASAFDQVIPILSIAAPPSSNQCELIEDYMNYTKYNFGGTGFLF